MNVYEMFETDKDVEKDGIELNYGDFQITVARSGGANQKYNKIMERLAKPHQRAIQTETISKEIVDGLLIKAHAEAVVIGWAGITDRDGKELEFSVENCIKLFTDLPELFDDVRAQAAKAGLFRKNITDSIVGNSKA